MSVKKKQMLKTSPMTHCSWLQYLQTSDTLLCHYRSYMNGCMKRDMR